MGNTDFLIFTRILSFEDMNITSGMGCCFPGNIETKLISKYERHIEMNANYNKSEDKFLFFYNAFKETGMRMWSQEVK